MPTNLPAEAKAKWIKVMEARTTEEKIRALEEFLSSVPKHKGTERLREWATKRLAQLREELEEKRRKRTGGRSLYFVEKEGDAQIVVIGLPNSGKSTLVHRLTGAKTVIADYPFSTTYPVPGMLKYNDVYFQLVDTMPLYPGSALSSKTIGLIRNADGVVVVLDATQDPVKQLETILNMLREEGVHLAKPKGRVQIDIVRAGKTGIRVTVLGKLIDATVDDVRKLLESYRVYNAHVKLYGEVSIDDVELALFEATMYKPALVFVNKSDAAKPSEPVIEDLKKLLPGSHIVIGSALKGIEIDCIGRAIYDMLEIIRVYTKAPNAPPARKPLVLKRGATVRDVAVNVHSEFLENFLYARVWGRSVNYPGERVGLDHVLMDGDVVEIHVRG
ncbi:MAG: TGS domain-containing protein [Desulfurococcaceae archaeon]